MMKKKIMTFLTVSLIVIVIICVSVMSLFAITMSNKSEDAINKIGNIYMSSMNDKISRHFQTTIDLRLSQVNTIIENCPPENYQYGKEMLKALEVAGKLRNFDSLALLSRDGDFEMVYGEPVEMYDPDPFLKSLNNDEKKVALAQTASGKKAVMIGISTTYPMSNNDSCTALVAGMSSDYFNKTLGLDNVDSDDSLTFSDVISRDGSYIIRNTDTYDNGNYFDRLKSVVSESSDKNADIYISELKTAMQNNEDYSTIVVAENERKHIYCTRLSYSEWYLITVMPYGDLDETIDSLSTQRFYILIICLTIILITLAIIFTIYMKMTHHQIRALENARQEAIHANKSKSEFLSNMSHDIRTPMNAIVGMTAIATANIDDKQQVQNCLRKISVSSKHLLGLINDVLDMSKIESGKLTLNMDQISLREVMDSIVSIVQPQVKIKNQKFDVFIHDIDSENVFCDSVRFNQVLLNFLSNAVKFTPDGGCITVSMYQEDSPVGEAFVRTHIITKDNGIGMTPEFQKEIFKSFAREDSKRVKRTEGTGLGMAITKYIVDAMGGTIDIKSELGKGSEFHLVLDLEKASIPEEDMILPNWNMLVVDDDQQLCESTVDSLKKIGVTADWTLDGESAIEMVEHRRSLHDDYHIILLDWKLPGIDGIETARRIRKKLGRDIPILLISAYDWSEIENEAKEAGVDGFISKPLFKSTLYYGLKKYTDDNNNELPENKIEEHSYDFGGMKILLAEDNELNWEIAYELLSQLNLNIEHAENGQICVDMIRNAKPGEYKAILMDIRMPVMNGYEATEAIRKLDNSYSDIPIIAMTADAFSEDIKKCLDIGMNAHIAKPIDIKEVAKALRKFTK